MSVQRIYMESERLVSIPAKQVRGRKYDENVFPRRNVGTRVIKVSVDQSVPAGATLPRFVSSGRITRR